MKKKKFSIKLEAIVRNVGHLRIKEALLIAKLHPHINSRLELNTEYIINSHAHFKYIYTKACAKRNTYLCM